MQAFHLKCQITVQSNFDRTTALQYELVKKEIIAILKRRAEFLIHRTRQSYYFNGSQPSRLPALWLKENEQFTDITSIRDRDGTVLTEPPQINNTFRVFYEKLYSSEVIYDKVLVDNLLDGIDLTKLSPAELQNLSKPITLDELKDAACDMSAGKSPGLDGVLPEVYTTFWDNLGPLTIYD